MEDLLPGCRIEGKCLGNLRTRHKVVFPRCHLLTPALSTRLLLTILTFSPLPLLLKCHILFFPSVFPILFSHPSQEKTPTSEISRCWELCCYHLSFVLLLRVRRGLGASKALHPTRVLETGVRGRSLRDISFPGQTASPTAWVDPSLEALPWSYSFNQS